MPPNQSGGLGGGWTPQYKKKHRDWLDADRAADRESLRQAIESAVRPQAAVSQEVAETAAEIRQIVRPYRDEGHVDLKALYAMRDDLTQVVGLLAEFERQVIDAAAEDDDDDAVMLLL